MSQTDKNIQLKQAGALLALANAIELTEELRGQSEFIGDLIEEIT